MASISFCDSLFKTVGKVIYCWLEGRKWQEREEGKKGGRGRMKMEKEDGKGRKGKDEEASYKDGKRTILPVRKLAQG